MTIQTLASRQYKGILVKYSFTHTGAMVNYSSFGAFNGGRPNVLDITIENILIEQTSILDWVSLSVWEGLEEEIAREIHAGF